MRTHGELGCYLGLMAMAGMLLAYTGHLRAAPAGSRWGGDYFPNVPLVTQDGQSVRFYDDLIKGKVVAINFIYTACGDSCPMQTANLRQVYKLLADRMGKDIFFYSISIDPQHDTPEVLKDYADRFKISSDSGWTFLTGSEADTSLLRKSLGLFREDAEAGQLSEHNTSFLIGNESSGQWIKRSPFDDPKVLAWMLGRSLGHGKPNPANAMTTYANAREIIKPGKGEELFRSRCAACHDLGDEDGLGPGLRGVTDRRDKAWLARWLKTPDRMLAENDPIASDLFQRYQKLPMPNLRLSDAEADALIDYLARFSD